MTLRVGVPEELRGLSGDTGHGRMWSSVLARLERMPGVQLGGGGGRLRRKTPEVWLANGHGTPLRVHEPVVAQVHEVGWLDPALRDTLGRDFYEELAKQTEASVTSASRVITPSESARREVIEAYGLPEERVRTVPHGVDHDLFNPDAAIERRIRVPYVLFASLLHPRKNLDALREAMARLAARDFPHRLVIVGRRAHDRPDAAELEAAAEAELPGAPGRVLRVREPGHGELASLMAGAAAFCLPSLHEGFGLTALEAMACGTAVVVSDRGALPEIVGDAGIVVAPEPDSVEEALGRVLSDAGLRGRLSAAGVARAREFTWERTAEGWLAVLTEAASQG